MAAGGLPGDLSLAELFPSEVALGMGASSPDAGGPSEIAQAGQVAEAGGISGGGSPSRLPLLAGMLVTLAVLFGGGGWIWWRNRESAYWPA